MRTAISHNPYFKRYSRGWIYRFRAFLSRIPGLFKLNPRKEPPFMWQPPAIRWGETRILTVIWHRGRVFEAGVTYDNGLMQCDVETATRKLAPVISRALNAAEHPNFKTLDPK